jgi:hypothetical protein
VNKRERVETVYAMGRADRIPFVPAIYEHKGALIGKSPSEICRNPDYLYSGLMKELETYDPDTLLSKTGTNLATRVANGGLVSPELEF